MEDEFHRTEECNGKGSRGEVRREESGVRGSPENRKKPLGDFIRQRGTMFLKHGWPFAPCHGTNMAGKKLKPLH
jgi:hypothetical protein